MAVNISGSKRKTIGLMTDSLMGGFIQMVWSGVQDAAEENDVNLILFPGSAIKLGTLITNYSPRFIDYYHNYQRNVMYHLINPHHLDALIMSSGSVFSNLTDQESRKYYRLFGNIPLVSISRVLPNIPTIRSDNESGMYKAVIHLIEVHGRKKIAFLKGIIDNQDSEERFHSYRKALEDKGIPFNEDLVRQGNFQYESGISLTQDLLDRRLDFNAIIAANDNMALGALQCLKSNGCHTPEDVAVIGFDDIEESRSFHTPLATVRQSLYEQGKKSLETALDLIAGKPAPDIIITPSEFIPRASCGCQSKLGPAHGIQSQRTEIKNNWTMEKLDQLMIETLENKFDLSMENKIKFQQWYQLISKNLLSDLSIAENYIHFMGQFRDLINDDNLGLDDMNQLEHLIKIYQELFAAREEKEELVYRSVFLQIGLLISETREKMIFKKQIQLINTIESINSAAFRDIMIATNLKDLLTAIYNKLEIFGNKHFYMALFRPEPNETIANIWRMPKTAELVLAFQNGVSLSQMQNKLFESARLLPDDIPVSPSRTTLALNVLFSNENLYGYILLDNDRANPFLYEMLALQISAALRSVNIIQELMDKRHEMDADLVQAASVQKSILTPKPVYQNIKGIEIDIKYLPMTGTISGDYYNVSETKNRSTSIIVADAAGHGIQAALSTMQLDLVNKESVHRSKYPDERLEYMNNALLENPVNKNFFTAFIVNFTSDKICYSSAAHPPQYLIKAAGGKIIPMKSSGKIIGMLPELNFEMKEEDVEPGDTILLFTDGILEQFNPQGEEFGEEHLMVFLVNEARDQASGRIYPPAEINARLLKRISEFAAGKPSQDDITLICIRITGEE